MGKPPENDRQLSTWMGQDDLLQLVQRCIEAPDIGYTAVWGISANTRAYYDLSEGNAIGYAPTQNAEDWAAELQAQPNSLQPLLQQFQGGAFLNHDFTPAADGKPR